MRVAAAICFGLLVSVPAHAADGPVTLKNLLLEQLKTTHDVKEWFVPANIAVDGLTAEQASWKDGSGNHSIGQLAAHLVFWNQQQLSKLKGEPPPKYSGNNEDTFSTVDAATWSTTVRQLDSVMKEIEAQVEKADDKTLSGWASAVAHIGTHNAYHVGQILYIRKMKGWWDSEKGVK
jgi:hypothetical protein